MRLTGIVVTALFLALLGGPLLLRTESPRSEDDAETLIIITPHNEQIRTEFKRGFEAWYEREYGERVAVVFNVPGGTSEIRKMLKAEYGAALESGGRIGGNADLVFGGGTYEHGVLKRGVTVTVDGEKRSTPITMPVVFDREWLDARYGENRIGDGILYDEEGYWWGTALSGFGIVFNRDVLERLEVPEPEYWVDACDPRLRGWVAMVNPGQSGSVTTAFEAIFKQRGWQQGWRILRRMAANGRYFSGSSLKPPADVSQGDAAMGVCIDFYGRFQSQAIAEAGDRDRVGYVDPPGESMIDPDPISMLRGAPHPKLAKRFIEFCLTDDGQALWQFGVEEWEKDGLGPHQFELRRMPVVRAMYEQYFERFVDRVNPFELASSFRYPNRNYRAFIAVLFSAMAMDVHEELQEAWEAIVTHPSYPPPESPTGRNLVMRSDVKDAVLREMLELFDAMPEIAGPDGAMYSLAEEEYLGTIKAGWLRGGWKDAGLWPEEASGTDTMRRRCGAFFRKNYRRIVALAGADS